MLFRIASRLVTAKAVTAASSMIISKVVDGAASRIDKRANPHRTRKTVASSAVPSAVIGGALMYFFDPKHGPSRRSSILSPIRGRTGPVATVNDIQERSKQVIKTANKDNSPN